MNTEYLALFSTDYSAEKPSTFTMPYLNELHSDLLKLIISHLDACSRAMLKLTCKRIHPLPINVHVSNPLFELAIKNGYLDIVKYLSKDYKLSWKSRPCTIAAHYGHLHILKWLRSEDYHWCEWTCAYAARNGHFEVLKWLRSEGCPWDSVTWTYAGYGGHFEVLKWLGSEGCPAKNEY